MIKKSVFNEVGGYNADYDDLPIEDTDLFIKCIRLGKKIIMNHGACIIHHEAKSGGMRHRFLSQIPAIENLKWLTNDVFMFYTKILPKELFIRLLIITNYRYFLKAIKSPLFIFYAVIHFTILPFYIYKLFQINKS